MRQRSCTGTEALGLGFLSTSRARARRAARHEAEELRRQLLASQAHARGLAAENAVLRERLGLDPAPPEPKDADTLLGYEGTASPASTPRASGGHAPGAAAPGVPGTPGDPVHLRQGFSAAADAGEPAAGASAGKPRSRLGPGAGRDGPGAGAALPGTGAGGGHALGALAGEHAEPKVDPSADARGVAGGNGEVSSEALLEKG